MTDPYEYLFTPTSKPATVLHFCTRCGAVVPAGGIPLHDDWHDSLLGPPPKTPPRSTNG